MPSSSRSTRFRDECLSQTWFTDLDDAQAAMAAWARDYNSHVSRGASPPRIVAQLLAEEALEEAI